MEFALIYRPAKTATQSGKAKTKAWVLEFSPKEAQRLDPLMGWTGSGDTKGRLQLSFDSEEGAVAFAKEKGIAYKILEEAPHKVAPKSYGDNFQGLRERL